MHTDDGFPVKCNYKGVFPPTSTLCLVTFVIRFLLCFV